jgi:sugar O-acyltransferase (sialic acid O-acetyltransferase NeuD family)
MILYGAGGHASVVYESMKAASVALSAVFDDNESVEQFAGLPVFHQYTDDVKANDTLLIAIGSNNSRHQLATKIAHRFGKLIDPRSIISLTATMGSGSMVLAGAIVQADCRLGMHVIVNSGAVIEHDTEVGDFCHFAPGSVVCGGAKIGKGVLIGANATLLPGVEIGAWSKVAAGAVVLKSVPPGETVVGNPAHSI